MTTDAPKARIARMTGTFLVPGVSKNRRLYTKTNIAAAVETMRARLADPNGRPITLFSHHDAAYEDDTKEIAGHVTGVAYDPSSGRATYEADIADNDAGRNVVALAQTDEAGRRHLKNQSIRGWWNGPVESKVVDGQQVTTSDELEIDGIDFTHSPGVDEAGIATLILESVTKTAGARPPIVETAGDAEVQTATEAAVTDLLAALEEAYASVNVDNGPATIRVSGWGCAPANLPALVAKLAGASNAALAVLDPDNDGDIDGVDSGDGGDVAAIYLPESAPAGGTTEAVPASETAVQAGKEPAVATNETAPNTETPAAENAPARNLTEADVAAIAAAMKATESNKAAEAPETATENSDPAAPAVEATNTAEPDKAALVEALKAQVRDEVADEIRKELVEAGIGTNRRGKIRDLAEKAEDMAQKIKEGKATRAEMDAYASEAWSAVIG